MSEWWLSRGDGKTEGPLTTQTLVQGLVTGQIPKVSHICRVGEQTWLRVSQVDEVWEAANPEQVKTNVTERPWFLSGSDLSQSSSSPDVDADRARALTPQLTIDPTAPRQSFSTPLPQTGTHRELFARQPLPSSQKPRAGTEAPGASTPSSGSIRPKVPTLTGISDPTGARIVPSPRDNQAAGAVPSASTSGLPGLQALGTPNAARFTSGTMPGLPTLGALLGPGISPAQLPTSPLPNGAALPSASPLGDVKGRQHSPETHSGVLRDERLQSSSGAPQTLVGFASPGQRPMGPPKLPQAEASRVPILGKYGVAPPVAQSASHESKSTNPVPPTSAPRRSAPSLPQARSTRPLVVSTDDEDRTTIVHSPFVKSAIPTRETSHVNAAASMSHPLAVPEAEDDEQTAVGLSPIVTPSEPQNEDDNERTTIAKSPYVPRTPLPESGDDEKTTIAKSPYNNPYRNRSAICDEDNTTNKTIVTSPHSAPLKAATPTNRSPLELSGDNDGGPPARHAGPRLSDAHPTRQAEAARREDVPFLGTSATDSCDSSDADETQLIPPKVQPSLRPPLPHRSSGVGAANGGAQRRASPPALSSTGTSHAETSYPKLPSSPRERAASITTESAPSDPHASDLLLSDPSQLMEECYDDSAGAKIHPAPLLPLARNKAVEVPPPAAQAVLAPASTPPPPRRPRLPSAPSIVFKHEPLNHQEATQPAARILRELQVRKPHSGGFVLFLVGVLVAAATAYYFLRGIPNWS